MAPVKTVLIACSRLVDLAGAEMTVLELAGAFSDMGWAVSLGSFELGGEVGAEVRKMRVRHFDLSSETCFPDLLGFDLAWVHHTVAANRLLAERNLSLGAIVFSSLSHFNAMECPPLTQFRLSRYLVNSQENLEHFVAEYPELGPSVSVMNNSVPARYWECGRGNDSALSNLKELIDLPESAEKPSRLAVVSNHLPDEAIEAISLLRADGVHVAVFGATANRVRVSPDVLRKFDAVMTIGKTVQYGIAARIPVYCYDHFGGNGWVTPENFEQGRAYNFSGRGGRGRITAKDIRREIMDGYAGAAEAADDLHALGRKYFVLEENIASVLWGLSKYSPPDLSSTDSNILIRECGVFVDSRKLISYRDGLISDLYKLLEGEKTNARQQVEYRDALVAELREQLEQEKANARRQVEYRDALAAELSGQLEQERANAREQVEYRDALVAELRGQLEREKLNARAQVEYRDALAVELRGQLEREKTNAREQVEYRDALVAELRGQLEQEKTNAREQMEYRDALVAGLHGQLEQERANARGQVEYRDALVTQLHGQLEQAAANARHQIEYRDGLIELTRRHPIRFAVAQVYSNALLFLSRRKSK